MPSNTRVLLYSVSAAVVAMAGITLGNLMKRHTPAVPSPPLPAAATATAGKLARPPDGSIRIGLESMNGVAQKKVVMPLGGSLWDAKTSKRLQVLGKGSFVELTASFADSSVLALGNAEVSRCAELLIKAPLIRIGNRRYPGKVSVTLAGTGLRFVNELDIEQYLEGVLPGELPRGFGIEAQKALAVAARSYALVQSGKHGEYDLCDGTCCQMYLGENRGSSRGLAAVRGTRRECLWSGEDLAYAFYSADCGGESTSVSEVPLRDKPAEALPYLRPVKDAPATGPDFCGTSPFHRWVRRFTRQQLQDKLNARPATEVGTLLSLKVLDVDPSGRVRTVALQGCIAPAEDNPPPLPASARSSEETKEGTPVEKTVSGWELRRSVGALALKSTRMTVDEPEPGIFRFIGSGFGHGLGLCQIGANGMARKGYSYREILAHYYPGTHLRRLHPAAGLK